MRHCAGHWTASRVTFWNIARTSGKDFGTSIQHNLSFAICGFLFFRGIIAQCEQWPTRIIYATLFLNPFPWEPARCKSPLGFCRTLPTYHRPEGLKVIVPIGETSYYLTRSRYEKILEKTKIESSSGFEILTNFPNLAECQTGKYYEVNVNTGRAYARHPAMQDLGAGLCPCS